MTPFIAFAGRGETAAIWGTDPALENVPAATAMIVAPPDTVPWQFTARGNVAALKTVQRHGPYFLVGHSFGAVLAFEMAQQLRAGGDEVAQ